MTEFLSILIIEDDPDDLNALTAMLSKLEEKDIKTKLHTTSSLEEAKKAFQKGKFDIVLTDLYLPDSRGIDTFLEVQKKAGTIPILIVGDTINEEIVRETIHLGAQDYLSKSTLSPDLLIRTIHYSIERYQLQQSLKALSFTDELTGVYNRRGFLTLLEQQISLSKRIKKGFYLFIIDLDYLKQINDTHGHLMGDRALSETANCLVSSFRHHDIVGRIGGDEFAVVALNVAPNKEEALIQHILQNVENFNQSSIVPFHLSLSIGQAFFNINDEQTTEQLLEAADMDLYRVKRQTHEF